jgi:hypothetical protein
MALKDNDYYENNNSMRTMAGENGDYYIQLWTKDEDGKNQFIGFRACMSGGPIKSNRLKLAFAELHRAMEEAELNDYPE